MEPLPVTERVPVEQALGRIAAADVRAPIDLPPFTCSAMDGYALAARTLPAATPCHLELIGESRAGHPFRGTVGPGQCVRILTGAVLPAGADAVVIQENCERHDRAVQFTVPVAPGDNVRDVGQDVAAGTVVIDAGERLTPFAVGWLAAFGITDVAVRARPRVTVFSTGDEIRPPGSELAPGQVYDANRFLLRALLEPLPVTVADLGILPDRPDAIATALRRAADGSDLVLTSGGVSVGDADHVTDVVRQQGVLDIWRLNIKPGKPLAYGRIGRSHFFGLPGNPVSTVVTFLLVVQPALLRLGGGSAVEAPAHVAVLGAPIAHKPGREEYQRGTLVRVDGESVVRSAADQSSNRLESFRGANCLIRIPKGEGDLPAGTRVTVLPFFGLI